MNALEQPDQFVLAVADDLVELTVMCRRMLGQCGELRLSEGRQRERVAALVACAGFASDQFQSLEIAQRAYVMENGAIEFSGSSADLLASDRLRQAYLGV